MIVRPYREPPARLHVAMLDSPESALLETGELVGLRELARRKDTRVFAPWDQVDSYARAGVGELVCWGEEPIRWRPWRTGTPGRSFSEAVVVKLPYPAGTDFLGGLAGWRDWLWSHGATVGWSLGGTSMSLLRATLAGPLVSTNGELPPPRWTLGGRQHCVVEPGTEVHDVVQLDLPAAYSRTIGGLRYGGAWRRLDRPDRLLLETLAGAGWPILAHGRVRLPDGLRFGPLPRRPKAKPRTLSGEDWTPIEQTPYPVSGTLRGLWSWTEIGAALEAGASFTCDQAWAHATPPGSYPFAAWLDACLEGRELDRWPALLAKATANALWGQFVIDDSKRLSVQRWNGGKRTLPVGAQGKGHQKRAWDLGELVCGQVRSELWRMMIEAGERLVCAHTDGGWVAAGGGLELPEPWRVKSEASTLQVLDQQHLRYRQAERPWRYALSGVPAARAEEIFGKLWKVYAKGD